MTIVLYNLLVFVGPHESIICEDDCVSFGVKS